MKIKKIELSKIEQNENSRTVYKTLDLAELMQSMKKDGLLQPVGVKALGNGKYEAVFGNRRIVAARKLGWFDIDAHEVEAADDNERDIIGLIENMKRQNTSVQEDGRMFQVLKGRGLTEDEIAARLDISKNRIQTALEVVSVVPEEYRSKIVYTSRHDKRKGMKDRIAASTAMAILDTRRQTGLNRADTRTLFKGAHDLKLNIQQIQKIAPLVKGGNTLEEAIKKADGLERVQLVVFVPKRTSEKLQKRYKKKIYTLMYDWLETNEEFNVVRNVTRGPRYSHKQQRRDMPLYDDAAAD